MAFLPLPCETYRPFPEFPGNSTHVPWGKGQGSRGNLEAGAGKKPCAGEWEEQEKRETPVLDQRGLPGTDFSSV